MRSVVISGTGSGCGKTTVSLGIMALLRRKGMNVAPFKVGPDYVDPGFHRKICGRASRNLDGWMLGKDENIMCFNRGTSDSDIAVVEGVMGLYDGFDGKSEHGSTAQMAKWLDLPVVLVVNARSMARSVAAIVKGFESFDKDVRFAGVIFNNIGSSTHLSYLEEAIADHVNMPCLGGIPRTDDIFIPERHLGLVTVEDGGLSDEIAGKLADVIERSVDMDLLLERSCSCKSTTADDFKDHEKTSFKVRIGVAMDRAFCFYYQDNLDLLEKKGAELVFFSPLEERSLPDNIDCLYLGGGYPDIYASKLSENKDILSEIKKASDNGMPVYAESGGFVALCREIVGTDGNTNKMSGCFPFTVKMMPKLQSLGYREVTFMENNVLGESGQVIRGHEFRYFSLLNSNYNNTAYHVASRNGKSASDEGYVVNRTLGSFIHLHFIANSHAAEAFVSAGQKYKKERNAYEA